MKGGRASTGATAIMIGAMTKKFPIVYFLPVLQSKPEKIKAIWLGVLPIGLFCTGILLARLPHSLEVISTPTWMTRISLFGLISETGLGIGVLAFPAFIISVIMFLVAALMIDFEKEEYSILLLSIPFAYLYPAMIEYRILPYSIIAAAISMGLPDGHPDCDPLFRYSIITTLVGGGGLLTGIIVAAGADPWTVGTLFELPGVQVSESVKMILTRLRIGLITIYYLSGLYLLLIILPFNNPIFPSS
jgi:hypothetical protein